MDDTNSNNSPIPDNLHSVPGDIYSLGDSEVIVVKNGVAYLLLKIEEMDITKMFYRHEAYCPDCGIIGQYMYQIDGKWVNYCQICYHTWTVKRLSETSNTK